VFLAVAVCQLGSLLLYYRRRHNTQFVPIKLILNARKVSCSTMAKFVSFQLSALVENHASQIESQELVNQSSNVNINHRLRFHLSGLP
jgi:hypothetical protein